LDIYDYETAKWIRADKKVLEVMKELAEIPVI